MPSLPLPTTVRNLNRLQHIVRVLARHGFGHVVERMNLGKHLPLGKLLRREPSTPPPSTMSAVGRRLASASTELGPTFVKLAQMFSTRPDLIPEEIVAELRTLQDHVPPFDHNEAMRILEAETGAPIAKSFASIEDAPFACGSIGQVYHARTASGDDVVVKIKRPGIEETVQQDLQLLKWLAATAEQWMPELARIKPPQIIDEFEQLLKREMDYVAEASSTARFEEAFKGDDYIQIPRVHWNLTSGSVLTLRRLNGQNVDTLVGSQARGIDRKLLARRLVDVYLKQFFDLGIYHADPHPGNILVSPPARIGLIDFGQVGVLTNDTAGDLVVMIVGMLYRQPQIVVDVLSDLGAVEADTDVRGLTRSMRQLIDKYHGLPLKRIDLAAVFSEMATMIRAHNVTFPREMIMVLKTLTTIAGVGLKLDPELDLASILSPRLKGLVASRFAPANIARTAGVSAWHLLSILKTAPAQLRTGLRQLSHGKWQINIRHENLDRLVDELDRSSNRMSFSIVIAAVIVGSSLVISTDAEFLGIPLQWFGIAGYLFAGVLGVGLLWAIFRSGRLS